jgi:hypothetical protein
MFDASNYEVGDLAAALLEVNRTKGDGHVTPRPKPDPAMVAGIEAHATARHAHHEAGHASAAVFAGGTLKGVWLGATDWSTDDTSADTPGGTWHDTAWKLQPFVTFAGPWAEAMWTVEHDDDVDDIYEALEYAWEDNSDGDAAKYEHRVAMLNGVAAQLGFSRVGCDWEVQWVDKLEPLWPAICEIAAMLIDGQPVTHEDVQAAVDRCPND